MYWMKHAPKLSTNQIMESYKQQFLQRITPAVFKPGLEQFLHVVECKTDDDGTIECRLEMIFHSWMEPITGWAIIKDGVVSMVERWQVGDIQFSNPESLTSLTHCCQMATVLN